MKKYGLLLSLVLSSSVFAMQCPPGNALHHPVNGGEWQLDPVYKTQGFYIESDGANATEVPAGTPLHVKIYETANDNWYAACRYILNNDKGFIKVLTTQAVRAPIPPNSPPFNAGTCQTTSDNPAACSWEVFDKK